MRMCHFRAQNGPLLLLSSTYWPFLMCKILQKFLQRIQSYKDASFLGPKWFICPKQFFLEKKLSFASTYWPLSFCKIFKKFLEQIQSYEDVPFSGPKYPNLSWTKYFGTNHYYYFHQPIDSFHWENFKKNYTANPELWGCTIFGSKWSICPRQNFFWKIINIALIYLLAPFILTNFIKILPAAQIYDAQFLGPK